MSVGTLWGFLCGSADKRICLQCWVSFWCIAKNIYIYVCVCIYVYMYICVCFVAQSWLTLCDPMDCSMPGSSVHGILQARILESVAMSSSRGSSQPRDGICISCIGRQILYHWANYMCQLSNFLKYFRLSSWSNL